MARRLAERFGALLPARFGESAANEAVLAEALAPRSRDLAEALERVRGCVQMTLRVFGAEGGAGAPLPGEPAEGAGPGARYLAARRREHERRAALPEIEPLREALKPLLRAERVERAPSAGRLLGSAYHLVPVDAAPAYRETVAAARLPNGCRVTASGPWPPYAFAPGVAP